MAGLDRPTRGAGSRGPADRPNIGRSIVELRGSVLSRRDLTVTLTKRGYRIDV